MSTATDRVRQHRLRKKQGRMLLVLDVNKHDHAETLIATGELQWDQAEDDAAIAAATIAVLKKLKRRFE